MTRAKLISERQLAQTVRELTQAQGWKCYQVLDTKNPAKRTSLGYPDLTIPIRDTLWLVELKTERGVVSAEQEEWREILEQITRVEYRLWRPSDLLSGEIEKILAARTR